MSGGYVKEQLRLSARLAGSVKGAGSRGRLRGLGGSAWRLPAGHKGVSGAGGRVGSALAGWEVGVPGVS